MFNLDSIMHLIPLDDGDLPIDHEFIADFLQPYFPDLARHELLAKIHAVIGPKSPHDVAR